MTLKTTLKTCLFGGAFVAQVACSSSNSELVKLGGINLKSVEIDKPALYPETMVYNPKTDKFLVGSFRDGSIYEIDGEGKSEVFLEDERLNSVLGIEIDAERNRLLVVNADIGSGIRSTPEGLKKLAALGIFELSTGQVLHYVDLSKLRPEGEHLPNGLAIDSEGNAYVTDSFSPVIYKVTPDGKASVFLEDERFAGEGINLNGIVYHPDGYLITVNKSAGVLYKIPLADPKSFTHIQMEQKVFGGDGILMADPENLVLVSNIASGVNTESAVLVKSTDGWQNAELLDEYKLGEVYPTTATLKNDKIYAIHSKLNVLNSSSREKQQHLAQKATIRQIGTVKR